MNCDDSVKKIEMSLAYVKLAIETLYGTEQREIIKHLSKSEAQLELQLVNLRSKIE